MTVQEHRAEAAAGFWIGGYEGADHVNGHGLPLDLVRSSGHWDRIDEDHRLAAQAGLRCVRESIGWRLSEGAGGAIDLTRAVRIQASARRHGLQVLWTLMHYGLPGDLSLYDDAMIPRLVRFAAEVARVLGPGETRPPVFTPVNEIGFLAWAAAQPMMFAPPNNLPGAMSNLGPEPWRESSRVSGYAIKRRLARAAIGAMAAIQQALPQARFLHVEPLVHVVAPCRRRDLGGLARQIADWQWQAWDLLAGRIEPDLGGRPEWLNIVGVNHYHSSQWEVDTEARLDWAGRDPRRRPLRVLLLQTWQRYRRPLIVAETSHVGVGRGDWLHEVADEVRGARAAGVPVQGLCIYPLVDRPDWQEPAHWHRSGLWHVDANDPALPRHAEPLGLQALRAWQQVLPQALPQGSPPPRLLLAFSHRRWDGLRHRTRHLLQALAQPGQGWQVVVVEPPVQALVARLDCRAAGPALQVLTLAVPGGEPGFHAARQPALQALLGHYLARRGLVPAVAWVDTPLAAPLARALRPCHLVYDCADEFTARAGAGAELARCEAELLADADLVFTAGTGLAASHAAAAGHRLRLLDHGVDADTWARASLPGGHPHDWASLEAASVAAPAWRAAVAVQPGPWLGYAGTIDERIDLPLLAALADARPAWQFMLVGPLRVDPSRLPRRSNLHWLGAQPYPLLPPLMARWRLAVLPWVLDGATRRLQPPQALEALAAGLPVVVTALPELQSWAAAGVHAAGTGTAAFLQACEHALGETAAQAAVRRHAAARRLQGRSWAEVAARLARDLATLQPEGTQEGGGAAPLGAALAPQGAPTQAIAAGRVPSALAR